jgi:hypothetical protein
MQGKYGWMGFLPLTTWNSPTVSISPKAHDCFAHSVTASARQWQRPIVRVERFLILA